MAVLGVHCAQLCASLTMEGRVQEAQRQLKAQQDLLNQIRYDCLTSHLTLTSSPGRGQLTRMEWQEANENVLQWLCIVDIILKEHRKCYFLCLYVHEPGSLLTLVVYHLLGQHDH